MAEVVSEGLAGYAYVVCFTDSWLSTNIPTTVTLCLTEVVSERLAGYAYSACLTHCWLPKNNPATVTRWLTKLSLKDWLDMHMRHV